MYSFFSLPFLHPFFLLFLLLFSLFLLLPSLPFRFKSSSFFLPLVFCAPLFWATPEFKEFHFLLPSSVFPPRHTWHQDALREIVDESGARPLLLLKQDCEIIISHGSGKISNPGFPSAVTITMTHFFHNVHHLAPKNLRSSATPSKLGRVVKAAATQGR